MRLRKLAKTSVPAPEQRHQHRIFRRLLLQQLVDDQIVVADHGVHEADRRADFGDVGFAPFEAERIFDAAFDGHDFEQRMVQQLFNVAADERVQIPELVNLDQVRVIARDHEVGVVLQKQVRDVVQMHQPVQRGRAEAVLPAKFVAQQPGGFVHVVNKQRVFGRGVRDVMVNDDPIRLVQARLEGEVRDPGGLLAQVALFPVIVMIGFQRDVACRKVFWPAAAAARRTAGRRGRFRG